MNTNTTENTESVSSIPSVIIASHPRAYGIEVKFPEGNFEINDLANKYNDVSRVTLQLRVNEALSNGKLTVVALRKSKRGRPAKIFKLA